MVRLRSRALIVMAVGALFVGWIVSPLALVDWGTALPLFGTWTALNWAASELQSDAMKAVLAVSSVRRAWLVAYLVGATLTAAFISFFYLFSHGARLALGVSLLALVYGWAFGILGLYFLLRADHPQEAVWVGGAILLLAVFTAVSPGSETFSAGSAWHPLTSFKFCLYQAVSLSKGLSFMAWLSQLKAQGLGILIFLSLVAWRGALRAMDRLELLPAERSRQRSVGRG
jgi:hypothetical protein